MSLLSRRSVAIGLALLLAGCASTSPTTSPMTSGRASTTAPGSLRPGPEARWDEATVELPAIVTAQASGAPLGQQCSPCHQSQVDLLLGVAPVPGGLIAVGIQEPPAIAVAWRSTDGRTWSPISAFPAIAGSEAAAAVAAHGRIVVVGGGPDGAAAWTSTDDGASWSIAPITPDLAGPHGTARMAAIVAWGQGFVAVGYQDVLSTGRPLAQIWTSSDGLAWHRVSDSGPAFAGAHIYGLAADGQRLVAVGTTGDQFRGPAGVWTSTDGQHWAAVSSNAFAAGAMAAVTAGGPGFVAVGSGSDDARAAAWVSADGSTWQSASDGPAFQHYRLPIRMAAVVSAGSRLVAVGWMSSGANGTGAVWRSTDGLIWRREPDQISLLGGELTDVAVGSGALIGVGLTGYPDNDLAQVWLGPP